MASTATPKKPVLKFPRNQCIACSSIILDWYHPVLLFGKRKEAGDLRSKFERFTTISLKEDDSYLKKICLRCKVKLDSAVCFKEMCLLSRKNQEKNLSRVKRGRIADEESCSPSSKRGLTRGFRKNLPTVLVGDKFPSIGEFFPLVLQQHLKIKKENKDKSNTSWANAALVMRR